ncbi:hypothetical protein F4V57_11995 [Acinetobacter qingfengensis]|uniref:Uncharacterized protein n=1 Tax=Acinetobacter qingfengensis TaxID=1262585 RepID=A0A1E7QXG4_9GAMM|nr:hypothetical protein [Acinetobacter qingfengensis]KAA8731638.1 hypothetical protein F4V57_11995 [Acinetobacter qingfengensis]OEY91741.1 hypothetical protein BJI46_06250 [Acinetobacter qingfengensis]
MSELNFSRLTDFLKKIPAIQEQGLIAHGSDGQHAWWIKFKINIEHALAWQTVQEFGHVLNYLSTNERLPTLFFPVSPPPYMNGEAKEFLAWIVQCNHADFPPDIICDWLEGRLPSPVDDEKQWNIQTKLDQLKDINMEQLKIVK